MFLNISNGIDNIRIHENVCVPLELEINKLEEKNKWRKIGDHLYYFKYPDLHNARPKNILYVSTQQFTILKNIIIENGFVE